MTEQTPTGAPAPNVPAANVPAADVPAQNAPAQNVPAQNVPAQNVPAQNVPAAPTGAPGASASTVTGATPPAAAPPPAAWPVDPDDEVAARRPGLLRRLLPRPWTALWLWLTWLLLNQTVEIGHLLLGAVLALVLAGWSAPPARPTTDGGRGGAWRRSGRFARLAAIVTWDIVVANLQVAARILGLTGALSPRFVWVPLDLRQPHAITLLAGIITMTPGTLSCELSDDRRHLLVHGLDVDDPDDLVAQIKARYETPIRELFE